MKIVCSDDEFRAKNGPWFAWRPVELEDGSWVWLQWVRRKGFVFGTIRGFDYSPISDPKGGQKGG